MAYIIIPDEDRARRAGKLLNDYGYERSNKEMYEAAEIATVRSDEAERYGHDMETRRYY